MNLVEFHIKTYEKKRLERKKKKKRNNGNATEQHIFGVVFFLHCRSFTFTHKQKHSDACTHDVMAAIFI